MKKIIFLILTLAIISGSSKAGFALAQGNKSQPKGLEDKSILSKITFVHYKKGYAKPNKPGKPPQDNCYGFLARGAKWKTTEDYLINPSGSSLTDDFVSNTITAGANEWEIYGGEAIFGNANLDSNAVYDPDQMDGKNVAAFGNYPEANVIAVTTIWGYFSGPPKSRELIEWDMLFDIDYQWGDALLDPSFMDLQNIATHELGHSAGLDDLYETACSSETMYGYSQEGETSKRDLNSGDIKGIQELY